MKHISMHAALFLSFPSPGSRISSVTGTDHTKTLSYSIMNGRYTTYTKLGCSRGRTNFLV